MKSNFLFILFLCSFCFGQNKENVYFLYEGKTTNILLDSIIKVDNQHFKVIEKDFKSICFAKIKPKLISFDNFVKKNRNKKFPDYYNNYDLFVYIPVDKIKGKYIKVEKVWIIDEPIE